LPDPLFKDVPTAKERGFNVVVTLWQGIGAPKGLPDAVRARLEEAFARMINAPETKEALRNLGLEPAYLGGTEFAKKWIDENAHYKQVVTETGILELVKSQNK
jgi:tripartite-type tricarboxylate transporter receptor subunit TctC